MKFVVHNTKGNGVAITTPALEWLLGVTLGGWPWVARQRKHEIDKMVRHGRDADMATRYIDALAFGGQTDAEAYALLCWRSLPADAEAVELIDPSDVPQDRWFRDAWRRSSNGGPIYIDLDKAIRVQAKRLAIVRRHTLREAEEADDEAALLGLAAKASALRAMDLAALGRRMKAARSPEELRALWPAALQ